MKRLVLFVFAILLTSSLSAQIQRKFWGLELSKSYTLSNAEQFISDKCEWSKINKEGITAYKGYFGGREWDFATFRFFANRYGNTLYAVTFSNNYNTLASAQDTFNSLRKSLDDKYAAFKVNDSDEMSATWLENDRIFCWLQMYRSESKGGDVFWYVDLNYIDGYYLDMATESSDDEL